jgi:hypothetical protein
MTITATTFGIAAAAVSNFSARSCLFNGLPHQQKGTTKEQ